MKAIVLAAGYGTRLGELGERCSKALLPVGRTPLRRLIDEIEVIPGIDEIYVITNNRFYSDFQDSLSGYDGGAVLINNNTDTNKQRKGAIRDLQTVLDTGNINDDIMVLVGDRLFTEPNLGGFYDFFRANGSIVNMYKDAGSEEAIRGKRGCVTVDGRKITGFEEKPEEPKSTLASLGFYIIPKISLPLIRGYLREGKNPDAIGSLLEWMIGKGEEVFGFKISGDCVDLGDMESYEAARVLFRE